MTAHSVWFLRDVRGSRKRTTVRPTGERQRPVRGMVLVELAVALALIGVLAVLTARGISAYVKTREHFTWRRAAAWAAESQLWRYQYGAPIDSPPPQGYLPAEITLTTRVQPGSAPWEGFDLVTVTARVTRRHGKPLLEQAACYIASGETP